MIILSGIGPFWCLVYLVTLPYTNCVHFSCTSATATGWRILPLLVYYSKNYGLYLSGGCLKILSHSWMSNSSIPPVPIIILMFTHNLDWLRPCLRFCEHIFLPLGKLAYIISYILDVSPSHIVNNTNV